MFVWYYYLIYFLDDIWFILGVDYRLCVTWIIHQQLWEYKVEDKLHLGVREQKQLNTTVLDSRLTDDDEVVSLTDQPPFALRKISGTQFC
jgi:hypothetical protein